MSFEDEVDDTDYLNASPAMMARIEQSDKDIEAGKAVKVDIDNLWK